MKHKIVLMTRVVIMLISLGYCSIKSSNAQSNYLTVFGNSGCGTGTGDFDHKLICGSPPSSSMSAVNFVNDPSSIPYGLSGSTPWQTNQMLYNSQYDHAGNLLFSANATGIYDASGTFAYSFFEGFDYFYSCSGSTYLRATLCAGAVSEICIVPKPGHDNCYYAFFWCESGNYSDAKPYWSSHSYDMIFRAVEIDVDPSTGGLTFTNNLLTPPNCTGDGYFEHYSLSCEVVADLNSCDGSINIYTVDPQVFVDGGGSSIYYGAIRKWQVGADGSLPTSVPAKISPTPTGTADAMLIPGTTKAKLLRVKNPSGSTSLLLAYPGVPAYVLGGNSDRVQTYDVNTGDHNLYVAPSTGTPKSEIWGFEYLPSCGTNGTLVFAYFDPQASSYLTAGGLAYATPVVGSSGSAPTITPISSTYNYEYSDLELTKNGDLLLVYQVLPSSSFDGSLAYIPSSSLTSLSSLTGTAPTRVAASCSGQYISISNLQFCSFHSAAAFYLGAQNRSASMPATYIVYSGTSETWTHADNPITNVTGVSTYTITANNIIIQPGASLTINGLTVKFSSGSHVDVYASPASSSYIGGRLSLINNSTLTSGACGNHMWGGVRVWGDPTQIQPDPPAPCHQGWLNMANSKISYASVGAYIGEFGFTFLFGVPIPYYAGGGVITASGSTFYNNSVGVDFLPYNNYYGFISYDNLSSFTNCTFKTDDPTTVSGGTLYGVLGNGVKGIKFWGCTFQNHTGTTYTSFGIYASNMGFTADNYSGIPSTFSNYTDGIYHTCTDVTHTAFVRNSIFTNNINGVYLSGSFNPVVINNTFNIPHRTGLILHFPPIYGPIQTTGLELFGATHYAVMFNTFQLATGTPAAGLSIGAVAWKTQTGFDENLINNNWYFNLDIANLSNYKNRAYNDHGLWYRCNNYRNNLYDEAVLGSNNDVDYGDGIRYNQGIEPFGWYTNPAHVYNNGFPSANTFTSGSTRYNLYREPAQVAPFVYYYQSVTPVDPLQIPNVPPTTGVDHYVAAYGAAWINSCTMPFPTKSTSSSAGGLTYSDFGGTVLSLDPSPTEPAYNYGVMLNNVNYYMRDAAGMTHRDSLYYWIGQLNSTAGKLAICNLLVSDNYADSAEALFNSIPATDGLGGIDQSEFNSWGKKAFHVQKKALSFVARMNSDREYAYDNSLDPDSVVYNDSSLLSHPMFDSSSEDSLTDVFNHSRYWGRILAENLFGEFHPEKLAAMLDTLPDTLLYPNPDTLPVRKWPSGVLTVTELSQGPSEHAGCEYAEFSVSSCGSDASPIVDVSGWLIDDNSGNFDTVGCSATGITRGHYRLAPGDAGWQGMPVGSTIVIYNADANCYNLPDTFTVDTTNLIFWLPIHHTGTAAGAYALERYDGSENSSPGTYCSDTGANVYTPAFGWDTTIALAVQDAVQVRCPGCTAELSVNPTFYQGVGYAPDTTYCFRSIAATSGSLGGPVIYYPGSHNKYVFIGSSATDFASGAMWAVLPADTAGVQPPTLGNVDSGLYANITSYSLGLPCCGTGGGRGKPGHSSPQPAGGNVKQAQQINVYPNPATMTVYFDFPPSEATTIKLLDITGRTMDERVEHNATSASFDVSRYAAGMYIYQVTGAKTQTGKILIGK